MAARACLILLVLLFPASAWAQGAVQWFGGSTVGHLPMITGGALLMDGGGSTGAGLQPANNALAGTLPTGIGFINTGQGICQWTNHSDTAYTELCSGFDGNGNALFKIDRIGGGPDPTCTFLINGVSTPCGGSGTVTSITATAPIVVTPSPITTTGVVSVDAFTNTVAGVAPASGGGTSNFLRADGTWAVPPGSSGGPANPTATIGTSAVNGSALTFMRSDGAPAIPQCSSSTFGACKVDGTTITASSGVISSVGAAGANPTATAGASAVNGVATTFMRSDGAPALTAATTSTAGIAKLNNVGYAAGWIATNNPNNAVVVNVHQASTITAITGTVEIPVGSAATVSVYKAASGVACSAGTLLHSGSFNANGTAATDQTLTLVGGATDNLADGDRICYQTTGTTNWTSGTGVGTITVFFAPS